ncbi:MAG: orotidine-5'-phosphate decarboxylase [Alphaproteobacteria bacterium]|nr:orotidine-5'-phosphate decarboxylase [Hyphomicrobiales bacterium]
MIFNKKKSLFCALDTKDLSLAVSLVNTVKGHIDGIKIGLEAYYSIGIEGYRQLEEIGIPIFLDLKLHDIPNTVHSAIKALLPLKPAILNIHASGGEKMMKSAVEAISDSSGHKPLLIGVTVLTSLDSDDLIKIGVNGDSNDQALRLAELAKNSGLDGVVCSPFEAASIKEICGNDFITIVPGIRPKGSDANDQKRFMTPHQAINNGADIIVIGRPITASEDPLKAVIGIREDMNI